MKIQSIYIEGLHSKREPFSLHFNDDLNIISGKNGAGKTTILKLIWYFISGNLEKALIEVPFKKATLETDVYTLSVIVNDDQDYPYETFFTYKDKTSLSEEISNIDVDSINQHTKHIITKYISSSYFFPTFRMIEGGFSTEKYDIKHELFQHLLINNSQKTPDTIDLVNDFRILSNKLSNKDHRFITSVSSSYINELLISKYAEIMSLTQPLQAESRLKSQTFFDGLNNKNDNSISSNALNQLNALQKDLDSIKEKIDLIKKPLKRFEDSMKFFLKNYEFHFGNKVQFSDTRFESKVRESKLKTLLGLNLPEKLFDINVLSSGEKQILTLISYNSFFDDTIFFIDEPENSLHADWQRILFRILMKQNPSNQFIITTHSPFIYSKYPDKELCVHPKFERGNEKVNHE